MNLLVKLWCTCTRSWKDLDNNKCQLSRGHLLRTDWWCGDKRTRLLWTSSRFCRWTVKSNILLSKNMDKTVNGVAMGIVWVVTIYFHDYFFTFFGYNILYSIVWLPQWFQYRSILVSFGKAISADSLNKILPNGYHNTRFITRFPRWATNPLACLRGLEAVDFFLCPSHAKHRNLDGTIDLMMK